MKLETKDSTSQGKKEEKVDRDSPRKSKADVDLPIDIPDTEIDEVRDMLMLIYSVNGIAFS